LVPQRLLSVPLHLQLPLEERSVSQQLRRRLEALAGLQQLSKSQVLHLAQRLLRGVNLMYFR
jgi:hypothetical protein